MTPIVSIIIPCYNQGRYLAETIDSVLSQTFQDWEAIIVDDGSTDNSSKIAKEYVQKDLRIHYIHQTNGGVSKARNAGIKNSCGQYILPLDGDDIILPNYLSKAVAYLDAHSSCKLFYCKARFCGDSTEPFHACFTDYKSLLLSNSIFNCFLYRREDAIKTGGYDETFLIGLEDWEFVIRLLANGGEVYQDEEIMFLYRLHNSEQTSRNMEAYRHEDEIMCQIYAKHQDIYNRYYPNAIRALQQNKDLQIRNEEYSLQSEALQKRVNELQSIKEAYESLLKKEHIYLNYSLFKIVYKFFRFYRKRIKKEDVY